MGFNKAVNKHPLCTGFIGIAVGVVLGVVLDKRLQPSFFNKNDSVGNNERDG